MSEQTMNYPSINRRAISFCFFAVLTLNIYNAKIQWIPSNIDSFAQAFNYFTLYLIIAAGLFFSYKLALVGMTLRHFVFGYRIAYYHDNSTPSLTKLYAREAIAIGGGLTWLFKRMFVPLLKICFAGATGKFDQKYVASDGNNLYVSKKTVGEIEGNQINHQNKQAIQEDMQRFINEGFIQDTTFGTYAVKYSRRQAIKDIFMKNTKQVHQHEADKTKHAA